MGIDRESDVAASLQIGPTSLGRVRIYVETDRFDLPLDFDPDEAEEIAGELMAAAARAREAAESGGDAEGRPRAAGQGARGPDPKRRRGDAGPAAPAPAPERGPPGAADSRRPEKPRRGGAQPAGSPGRRPGGGSSR